MEVTIKWIPKMNTSDQNFLPIKFDITQVESDSGIKPEISMQH